MHAVGFPKCPVHFAQSGCMFFGTRGFKGKPKGTRPSGVDNIPLSNGSIKTRGPVPLFSFKICTPKQTNKMSNVPYVFAFRKLMVY